MWILFVAAIADSAVIFKLSPKRNSPPPCHRDFTAVSDKGPAFEYQFAFHLPNTSGASIVEYAHAVHPEPDHAKMNRSQNFNRASGFPDPAVSAYQNREPDGPTERQVFEVEIQCFEIQDIQDFRKSSHIYYLYNPFFFISSIEVS